MHLLMRFDPVCLREVGHILYVQEYHIGLNIGDVFICQRIRNVQLYIWAIQC